MKKFILSLIGASALVFAVAAKADQDCDPAIAVGNKTAACACIWSNVDLGCQAHGVPGVCGLKLFNNLKKASDDMITNVYCIHADDKRGCIGSLHYFREPGHGADIPAQSPYPAYVASNCPCIAPPSDPSACSK